MVVIIMLLFLTHVRYVGPYVTLSQELSFVLEDDEGVCGYVLAALDSRHFYKQFKEKWTPSVIGDYPSGDEGLTPEEKVHSVVAFSLIACCFLFRMFLVTCVSQNSFYQQSYMITIHPIFTLTS